MGNDTETLYRKVGNRYVEAGMRTDVDLYPGVWMVQKGKNSTSMQSICVSELPEICSLIEVVQIRLIAQLIMEKLKPLWDAEELVIYNHSYMDLEHMISDALVTHVNKGRKEALNGGYDEARLNGRALAIETLKKIEEEVNTVTWGTYSSRLQALFGEINEIGHRKVGTHEFSWYIHELKDLLKKAGFDLKNVSVGGLVANPDENDE